MNFEYINPKVKCESIDILNFKNIAETRLEFSPGVNCFVGRNGMGKSNLLEAVHFLSLARPMQSMPESALIRHGEESLLVKGHYKADAGTAENVSIGITRGKPKKLLRNGKEYDRLSDHIGRFPIVAVTPADSMLVTGEGALRRKLVDVVISQTDSSYLSRLIRYNKALESRNRMLRAGVRDKLLYESIESVMAESAAGVYQARRQWTEDMKPVFARYYSEVTGDAERVSLGYVSVLHDRETRPLLDSIRAKDEALGYTSQGIHRDDLRMELAGHSLKRVGSQGQIKSYVIALRLAIFDYVRRKTGITPILLLDDIFDKLDSSRVAHIMKVASGNDFGQIFITDTNREHLDETIATLQGPSALFEVSDGKFKSIG